MCNKRLIIWLAIIFGAVFWPAYPLTAQDTQLVVHIDWPNEGETLYAGPTSLLYSVPVSGHVTGRENSDEPVFVQLEIIQNGAVFAQHTQQLQEGDTFSFNVTVNPEASMGQFPTEKSGCIAACHFPSDLTFPSGPVTLRVSVTRPRNANALPAERHISVDRSSTATIPVKVVLDDESSSAVSGVQISAATRLYLWRTRHGLAETNEEGVAQLRVEALHEAPTTYVLTVQPTVVNGVLYEGAQYEAVEVTLPPAAEAAPPVTLTVYARRGQIEGKILPAGAQPLPDSVWAICLPDGESFQVHPGDDAGFRFNELPVDQVHLALDPAWLMAHGRESAGVLLNLEEEPSAYADISLASTGNTMLAGRVVDEAGEPLPFAWITMEEDGKAEAVLPVDGRYTLPYRPDEPATVIATAPGFYSRAELMANIETGDELEVPLSPRPDTENFTWGDGAVLLPADSRFQVSDSLILLERGWLWGENGSDSPLSIRAGGLSISLPLGRFAIEYLPPERGWLYLPAGEAIITDETGNKISVTAGQMVNLLNKEGLKVVNYEEVVVQVLGAERNSPLAPQWQPTFRAQVRDRLALVGIGVAQVITFVTYFLLLLSLLLVPLVILYFRRTRRREGNVDV